MARDSGAGTGGRRYDQVLKICNHLHRMKFDSLRICRLS